ncbi:MAG: PAS domain S-box protein [Kiritimatiellae bacterium]|nr:PAS domain S-box protein [Kiritimatiellia bacterium]
MTPDPQRSPAESNARDPRGALERLADRLPDLLYRYEFFPLRRFTFVSAAAERLTGYTVAEHYADPDLGRKIVHPADRDLLERLIVDSTIPHQPLLLRWIRKDGRVLWTEHFVVPIHDAEGRLVAIEGLVRDVTDAHEARVTLEAICKALRDAVVVLDRDGIHRYVVPGRTDLLPRSPADLLGRSVREVYPAETADRLLRAIDAALRAGREVFIQYSREREGRQVWLETSVAPFGPDAVISVTRDISERIRGEEESWRARQFAAAVLDALASSICLVDAHGRIVTVNESWNARVRESGADPASCGAGADYLAVARYAGGPGPEYRATIATVLREISSGERSEFGLEHDWSAASGVRRVYSRFARCPAAGPGCVLIMHTDVTDRYQAEAASRESEDRYRNLFRFSPAPLLVDIDGRIAMLNEAARELFGAVNEDEMIGRPTAELFAAESRTAFAEAASLARDRGTVIPAAELALATRGDLLRIVEARIAPFRLGDRPAIHLMLRDVTATRAAEQERRRLEAAIEQAAEAIVITDTAARILYVNPAFERITGYSREEVLGRTPQLLKSGHHSDAFYRELWTTITAGRVWHGRFVNRRRDGRLYTEEATISPVMDEAGRIVHYVAVKRDVTAELQMEAELEQSRRLELVGQMAGGLAHDFNNVLGVVLGETELALQQLDERHPLAAPLQAIRTAAEHGAALARQLLGFARRQSRAVVALSLNDGIARCLPLLHGLGGDRIQILWRPGDPLWSVRIDPNQLDEVLLNLMSNARDAISGTGTVTIETMNVRLDEVACARRPGWTPGDYVRLTFSDTGCGMTAEVKARAFEPFFTTKEPGRGSGLGLSTVHGIVHQSGGFIDLDSGPGRGTRIEIYLPRCVEGEAAGESAPAAAAPGGATTPRRTARILVCEDQPDLLSLVRRMLERLGHQVFGTTDPRDAIRCAEEMREPLDLLIADLMMPHMDGRELAEHISARHPGVKCLFMSGYTPEALPSLGLAGPPPVLLQKPFGADELEQKISELLEGPAQPPPAPAH